MNWGDGAWRLYKGRNLEFRQPDLSTAAAAVSHAASCGISFFCVVSALCASSLWLDAEEGLEQNVVDCQAD